MKIIHITPVFHPYRSGMSNVVHEQTRELSRRGHEVLALTPLYDKPLPSKEVSEGVHVKRLKPLIKFGNAALVWSLYRELKEQCTSIPKPILHFHAPFFGGQDILWLVRRLGRSYGAKLLIQYHHDPQLNLPARMVGSMSTLLLRSLIKKADRVIGSSLDYLKTSSLNNLLDTRFVEVPLGVNAQRFKSAPERQTDDKLELLFIGSLDSAHHFKGLDILLQAIKKSGRDDLHLRVSGKGNLKAYFEHLTKQLNLTDKVEFLGFVPDEQLSKLHQQADLFVFPSTGKAEAFGLVALEAMASGLPVLASNLPGVRTLIANKSMLVAPGNINELADKLGYLADHKKSLPQIGQTNRKLILRNYTWPKVIDRLEGIYNSLISA